MGNAASQGKGGSGKKNGGGGSSSRRNSSSSANNGNGTKEQQSELAARAKEAMDESVRELQAGIQSGIKRLEDQDHPAAQLLDTLCAPYLDGNDDGKDGRGHGRGSGDQDGPLGSFYSEDVSESDSRTVSEDDTTLTDYQRTERRRERRDKERERERERDRDHHRSDRDRDKYDDARSMETGSEQSQSDGYESSTVVTMEERETIRKKNKDRKESSHGSSNNDHDPAPAALAQMQMQQQQPLASSFAKRCYFTKQGIGGQTQHYEGLTLTGNVVLMLASAMKLKGCPTICDEDLRRVEQTYPNQFSRLPDELLLSSGWRRISKYCHFSNKPIPDGSPFFHSKQRLHPSGGYYFLLAAAVGMVRPIDVEPLTRDTLVLLETDYAGTCDAAPDCLINDPDQWTLVDKFCFFSGGPINTDEDVYYRADFDGNPIYMLAFLSPSLTPAELYKLDVLDVSNDPGLKSGAAVDEVESVYDLTDRDFDDLKLYHLGPCRALPQYILQPLAWMKVLPPHFLAARQTAMLRAQDYEQRLHLQQLAEQQQHQQQQRFHHQHQHQHHSSQQQEQQQQHHHHHLDAPQRQSLRPTQMNQPYDDEDADVYEEQQDQHGGGVGMKEGGHYYEEGYDDEEEEPFDGPHHHHEHHGGSLHGADMLDPREFARQVEEEGAFIDDTNIPIDEAIAAHAAAAAHHGNGLLHPPQPSHHNLPQQRHRVDPPEDEPPSLSKHRNNNNNTPEFEQQQQDDDDAAAAFLLHQQQQHHPQTDLQQPPASYYPEYEDAEEYYDDEYFESSKDGGDRYYGTSPETASESVMSPPSAAGSELDDEVEQHTMRMSTSDSTGAESPVRVGASSMQQRRERASELPPVSPRSPCSDTYSQSSAMREAQELVQFRRNNRQRRSPSSPGGNSSGANPTANQLEQQQDDAGVDPMNNNPAVTSPDAETTSAISGTTWESGSDFTGSSVWTDNDSNLQGSRGDQRSSRRALILQMAKARMKSNKPPTPSHHNPGDSPKQEEEKKVDGGGVAEREDLDLAGDLD